MRVLGLDVGTRTIKGVVVERRLIGVRPLAAFERPLAGRPVEEVLAEVVATAGAASEVVVVSLPRQDVLVRHFTLPFTDVARLRMVVPGAAEGQIHVPLESLSLDFVVSGTTPGTGTDVLVFALPRALVEGRLALVPAPDGTKEVLAQVDSVGVVDAFLAERRPRGVGPPGVALVDVGAAKTAVEVLWGGRLVFSRHVSVAGDAFTQAVAESLGLEVGRAEEVKCALAREEAPPVDGASLEGIKRALAARYRRLAHELSMTLLAARDRYPSLAVEAVLLTGGGARTLGLSEVLAERMGLPVRPLALSSLEGVPGGVPVPHPAGAYGLALHGAHRAPLALDITRRPRQWVRLYRPHLVAAGVVLALLLTLQWGCTRRTLSLAQARQADLEARVTVALGELSSRSGERIEVKAVGERMAQVERQVVNLADEIPSPTAVLEAISRAAPQTSDCMLESITLEKGRSVITGYCDGSLTRERFRKALETQFEEPEFNQSFSDRVTSDSKALPHYFTFNLSIRRPRAGPGSLTEMP